MRCFKNFKRKRLVLVYLLLGIVILTAIIIHNHSFNLNRSFQNNGKSYNYDGAYPGNFMETYKPSNESYCNFMYNLPEEFTYEESDLEYSPELGIRSPYRVLYNVIRSKENFSSAASVTYATHLTTEFVSYITEVVRYWEGPLSVAAFVPDSDADILTKGLIHLCQCLPEMSKVSVHYVFPKRRTPVISKHSELSQTSFCSISHMRNVVTFRNRKSSPYPVNVCRNVARNASTTNFVLVSDVELIPSIKLASRFLDTISRLGDTNILNYPSRVFVVPVFEIESYEDVPKTKKDLLRLITQEKAVYFHRHICSHCQKFPGIEQWLGQDSGNTIKFFAVTSRIFPYHRWEPVYIGTKNEPFYSETLSWEGKQDKMTQMLEMCLKGYRFLILDGAFLVHWPGIKRKSINMKNKNKWRYPYQLKNSRQYNLIVKKLAAKYKANPKCKVQ